MPSPYAPITFQAPVATYGIEGEYFAKTGKNTTNCIHDVENDSYNCNYTLAPNQSKVFDPLSKTGIAAPGKTSGQW